MSNENWQKLCKVKIIQLQPMYNAIKCINQRFEFKNSGISCLALIFDLSNAITTILQAKIAVTRCKTLRVIYCSFSVD